MRTDVHRALVDDSALAARVVSRSPLRRRGEPGAPVGTVVHLAAATSHDVNGQIVYVDGDLLAVLRGGAG